MINTNYFNSLSNWDEDPMRVKLAKDIAESMKMRLSLSSKWNALDLGCGTGLVTMELAPYLKEITGIDSSCAMLDKLSEKIKLYDTKNVKTALRDLSECEFTSEKYNLIVSSMMLHHIEHPAKLISSIKPLLKPGGFIAIADLDSEDGRFHDDPTGVFHHGFSKNELTRLFTDLSFSNIAISEATSITKGDKTYPVLLTVAQSLL